MYEVTHRLRIRNNIKVKDAIQGLFIRKKDMRKIELSFGQMYRYIKMNSFFDYILLRSKLNKCKQADLEIYKRRADFEQIITMVDNVKPVPKEPEPDFVWKETV